MIDRQSIKILFEKASTLGVPMHGTFELTSRCNLKCVMCYICEAAADTNVMSSELSTNQWLDIAIAATKAGMLNLVLTGGEILVREDFEQLYTTLYDMGLLLTLMTNGTLWTDELIWMVKKRPPAKVAFTLYGYTRGTCKAITGNANSTELALNTIRRMLHDGLPVTVSMTVTKRNWHEFRQLSEKLQEMGIKLYLCEFLQNRLFGKRTHPLQERLNIDELEIFYQSQVYKNPFDASCKTVESHNHSRENYMQCNAAKSSFDITANGTMIPCTAFPFRQSFPVVQGFQHAWQSIIGCLDDLTSPIKCQTCEEYNKCLICPSTAWAETKNCSETNQYICGTQMQRKKWVFDNEKIL